MRNTRNGLFGLLSCGALLVAGCRGGESDALAITKIEIDDEQAAAIRSHDQRVDEEEGGAAKVTRPTKGAKVARQSR